MRLPRLLLLAWLGLLPLACATAEAPAGPTVPTALPRALLVFAASSLTDTFTELGKAFEATHPGVTVTHNFSATSTLRTQLTQGARADLFASADLSNMTQAQQAGLITGTPASFATNRLALAVPFANNKVATLRDLAKPGMRVALVGASVPIGAYTNQVLDLVSKDPAYGPAFVRALRANVVTEAANVRAATATVAVGETDAAFAYTTDVAGPPVQGLQALLLPEHFRVPVTYPIAMLRGAPQLDLARDYLLFVLSPRGQSILAKWGFKPPPAL